MKKISLMNSSKTALVDDDNYEYLNRFKWYLNDRGYAIRSSWESGNGKTIRMHREIMGFPEGMEIDHINRDKLDNRRINMRICTHSQNLANTDIKSINTSGRKGVTWDKDIRKWRPQISYHNKNIHLGSFDNLDDAAEAYDKKAKELFGDFALKGEIVNGDDGNSTSTQEDRGQNTSGGEEVSGEESHRK